jgi:hypothetical protein
MRGCVSKPKDECVSGWCEFVRGCGMYMFRASASRGEDYRSFVQCNLTFVCVQMDVEIDDAGVTKRPKASAAHLITPPIEV